MTGYSRWIRIVTIIALVLFKSMNLFADSYLSNDLLSVHNGLFIIDSQGRGNVKITTGQSNTPEASLDLQIGNATANVLGFLESRQQSGGGGGLLELDDVGAHFYFTSAMGNRSPRLKFFSARNNVYPLLSWTASSPNVSNPALNFTYVSIGGDAKLTNNTRSLVVISRDNSYPVLSLSGALTGKNGAPFTDRGFTFNYYETSGDTPTGNLEIYLSPDTISSTRLITISIPNNLISSVNGKQFIIPHPLKSGYYLVHGVTEGPENRVYYRGRVQLIKGKALVRLPEYFESLTSEKDRAVFLTNTDTFDRVAVKSQDGALVKDGVLKIYSDNNRSAAWVDWEVSAVRKDVPPLQVQRLKSNSKLHRIGPYTYLE